jgi:hypothetical protein
MPKCRNVSDLENPVVNKFFHIFSQDCSLHPFCETSEKETFFVVVLKSRRPVRSRALE